MVNALDRLNQPSLRTAGATFAAYALILLVLFVLIFVVPYLVFGVL